MVGRMLRWMLLVVLEVEGLDVRLVVAALLDFEFD
jgi:hypothetical protein